MHIFGESTPEPQCWECAAIQKECKHRAGFQLDYIWSYSFTASLGSFNFMFHFGYFQPLQLLQTHLRKRCCRGCAFPPQCAGRLNQTRAPFIRGKQKRPHIFQKELYASDGMYLLLRLYFFGDRVALLPGLGKKHANGCLLDEIK